MPRSYPCDQKSAALVMLERNRGNVPLTAQQIGVSENTLYAWQRSIQVFFQQNHPPPQQPAELPAFENDLEALAFIRQNIISELSRLSASLQHDPGFTTPYQRALVMSQLMDKMMKLDLHLQPYVPQERQIIRIKGDEEHGVSYEDEPIQYIAYERDDDDND